jgi:hypothetical protein
MKKAGELLFCSSNYNFRQSYRIDAGMLHAASLPEEILMIFGLKTETRRIYL